MATALLAGATGLVGGHLLRLLLEDSSWARVVSVSRRPPDVEHPKLEKHVLELRLIEAAGLHGIDQAFCCLGTTIKKAGSQEAFRAVDFEQVLAFARAALHAGATHFHLISSVGAKVESNFFYLRIKAEAEEAVKAAGFRNVHIYRPAVLLGARAESRPLEKVGMAVLGALSPLMLGPLARQRPVQAETVAAAMLRAAKDPSPGVHIHESETLE